MLPLCSWHAFQEVLLQAGGAVCEAARHNPARLWPPEDEPGPTPSPGSQVLVSGVARLRKSGVELDTLPPGRSMPVQFADDRVLVPDSTPPTPADRVLLPVPACGPFENRDQRVYSVLLPARRGHSGSQEC